MAPNTSNASNRRVRHAGDAGDGAGGRAARGLHRPRGRRLVARRTTAGQPADRPARRRRGPAAAGNRAAGALRRCPAGLRGVAGRRHRSHAGRVRRPVGRPAEPACRGAGPHPRAPVPRVTRRLVTATLGVALTTGLAGTALADPPPRPGLAGLTLPDRTTATALSTAVPRTVACVTGAGPTTCSPLAASWSAPATRCGASRPGCSTSAAGVAEHVTDADVTDAWHRLRDANRARVGPDPDLIRPGHLAPRCRGQLAPSPKGRTHDRSAPPAPPHPGSTPGRAGRPASRP